MPESRDPIWPEWNYIDTVGQMTKVKCNFCDRTRLKNAKKYLLIDQEY